MISVTRENELLDHACQNPEIAPFAWFTLEMPSGEPLWSITPAEVEEDPRERDEQLNSIIAHQQRVAWMANRVVDGRPALDDQPEPPDEWDAFWGGESPTQGGYLPRSAFPH